MEVDEKKSALLSNAAAISSVASAIEGTLGPKGLNCMLVDRFGGVTISNDGCAILQSMEVSHPVGRLLVQTAKIQDIEVGDGTTTACLLADTLIDEGVKQVLRGVPVVKLTDGIKLGIQEARRLISEKSTPVTGFDDPLLKQAIYISAREQEDITALVLAGAEMAGAEKLSQRGFRLADWVVAKEGADNEVFRGLLLDKMLLNRQMPRSLSKARILIFDDALEPEELDQEALATEAGFNRYREFQENFRLGLQKILAAKVNMVVASRGISELAEQLFTEAGIMALRRVSAKDLARLATHTGAKPTKRSSLWTEDKDLASLTGAAEQVYYDEKLQLLRVIEGEGECIATMLIGASTLEVRDERQRITEDAACVAQQALTGGVVAGGGAVEMSILQQMEDFRASQAGMISYGIDCVITALMRPLNQITANAGFNPLEKSEQVKAALTDGAKSVGIDCDTGEICDMLELGVVDAAKVKLQALKAAAEVADAVLKINTIIRKKEEGQPSQKMGGT